MKFGLAFLSTLVLLTIGCATTPLPQDRVTSLHASIRSAEEVGAKKHPQAALHLELAEKELARAKQLNSIGDTDRALLFLQRATIDAELAMAIARKQEAKVETARAKVAVRRIQGETP